MYNEPEKFYSLEQSEAASRIKKAVRKLKGKPRFNARNIMVSYQSYVDSGGRLKEVTKICVLDVFSYNPVVTFNVHKPLESIEEEDILPYAAMIRQPHFK
ncbi:hypothetical protein AB9P05_06750 [Roseivirga sp. BDSF3-8]|uniref:hypothetical protein n=1 Tax=Roseivirga sp. BDSF3-8 TaxID=3241598 RepID=UPI0035325C58